MKTCFVLMFATGQYDEYSVTPIGVYLDDGRAQYEAKIRNALPSLESYINKLSEVFWAEFNVNHPQSPLPDNPYTNLKPKYDHERAADKVYNSEYLAAKRVYQDLVFKWRQEIYIPTEREYDLYKKETYRKWEQSLDYTELKKHCRYRHDYYYVEAVTLFNE